MSAMAEKDFQAAFTHCKTRDTSFSPVQTRNPSIASLTCRAWSFTRSAKRKHLKFNSLKKPAKQNVLVQYDNSTMHQEFVLYPLRNRQKSACRSCKAIDFRSTTTISQALMCGRRAAVKKNLLHIDLYAETRGKGVGNLRNYLWKTKSRLRVIQICLRSIISNHIERQGL